MLLHHVCVVRLDEVVSTRVQLARRALRDLRSDAPEVARIHDVRYEMRLVVPVQIARLHGLLALLSVAVLTRFNRVVASLPAGQLGCRNRDANVLVELSEFRPRVRT